MMVNEGPCWLVAVVVAGTLLVGCASVDVVGIPYAPTNAPQAPNGGAVKLAVIDERPEGRDRISTKINGLGMNLGAVLSATDVPDVVHDALRAEFERRGFALTSTLPAVIVQIEHFSSDYATAALAFALTGDVELAVTVTGPTGAPVFASAYQGLSRSTVYLADGQNAAEAVAAALRNAIGQMFADAGFRRSLRAG